MAIQRSVSNEWPPGPEARHAGARPASVAALGGGASSRVERIVVGAASLALGLGLLAALWLLARPLALLVAAIVLADALEPMVVWLGRWLPRAGAVVLIYGVLLALVVIAGWLVVPELLGQARELAARAPEMVERARQLVDSWLPMARAYGGPAVQSSLSQGAAGQAVALPLTLFSSALEALLVVAMSAYWLAALPRLRRFTLSLVPPERVDEVRGLFHEIGQSMGGYVRGTAIDAVVVGTMVSVGMTVLGIPYPLVFGLLAALGEPFPYVGPIVAAVPAVLIAFLDSPTQALLVLGFYLAVQLVEGYLLFPLVVGDQTEASPLLVILGLLAGGAVGGVLGALVAIPLVAALRVLTLRLVVPPLRRRTGGSLDAAGSDG